MGGEHLLAADLATLAPAPDARAAPQVALRFADAGGRTVLADQRVAYPFHLGRSLHIQGDPAGMPTYYVQCCSGGVFEHDRLAWRIELERGAAVHLSTAASSVVHTMRDGHAVQEVQIDAGRDSFVEYLPEPLILFPDADLVSRVSLRVHPSARVLWSDAIMAHDPSTGGGRFRRLDAQLHVRDTQDRVLVRERFRLAGKDNGSPRLGATESFACQGSFLALSPPAMTAAIIEHVRTALASCPNIYAGTSSLPAQCGVWMRVLARDAVALRGALHATWVAARQVLCGAPPQPRRR